MKWAEYKNLLSIIRNKIILNYSGIFIDNKFCKTNLCRVNSIMNSNYFFHYFLKKDQLTNLKLWIISVLTFILATQHIIRYSVWSIFKHNVSYAFLDLCELLVVILKITIFIIKKKDSRCDLENNFQNIFRNNVNNNPRDNFLNMFRVSF